MKPLFAQADFLESLGYGYFELDLSGRLIYGNQTFFKSIGYEPEDLLRKHFRHYVDRKQVATIFNIFNMIYQTGQVEKKLPIDFVYKDGSPRTAEGSIALIRDENNEPVGFRGILMEITQRKQKETTLIMAKKRAERELDIARDIQNSFLVKDYPQPDGWEIASYIHPARQVGGDFYDVFPITTSKHIAIIIADVCDKGVGAAMYMGIFRSLLRAFSDQKYIIRWSGIPTDNPDDPPSGVFRRDAILASGVPSLKNAIDLTNDYIANNHGDSNMFATVFFGLLNPQDGTLLYINAGHEPPLLISNGTLKTRLDPTGPAVGMLPNMDFKTEWIILDPGDALILHTDGAADALNVIGQRFTEERLISAALQPADSAQAHLEQIKSALNAHIAKREQYDDITLLALRRKPKS